MNNQRDKKQGTKFREKINYRNSNSPKDVAYVEYQDIIKKNYNNSN